jgi:uncharacterized protein
VQRIYWLVGVLLLFWAGDAVFCNATLFPPRRAPGAMPAGFSEVSLVTKDGVALNAWFDRQTGGDCVMVLHGIGDSRSGAAGFAPMLLDAGYSVLLPDSRGHGRSGGEIVTYGLREKFDAVAWNSWLHQRGCKTVYGLGESLGGAILLQAAPLADFRAIVAEGAYSDLRSIARERIGQMTRLPPWLIGPPILESSFIYARLRYGVDLSDVSPLMSIAQTKTPILLIHGLADDRTPPWHSQALVQADSSASLWLVPGAGHSGAYAVAGMEFRNRVLAWFRSH